MNNRHNFVSIDTLVAGDIILGYGDGKLDISAKLIEKATGSKYKHAAICLNKKVAVESTLSGVKKDDIKNIINLYNHVAVFRQPDAWDLDRVNILNLFVDKIIDFSA